MFYSQVNYFPSRFDPVRHAERFPENRIPVSGARERRMIDKVPLKKDPTLPFQTPECPERSTVCYSRHFCSAVLSKVAVAYRVMFDLCLFLQENNFKQPGERYRSFDPARRERFVTRLSEVVGDARCTKV